MDIPDGTSHDQKKSLHQKTTTWDNSARSGHTRKIVTWFYTQTTVNPPIKYPLSSTTMTAKDATILNPRTYAFPYKTQDSH